MPAGRSLFKRIQTLLDGPGALGSGDNTKVLAWNNSTGRFEMTAVARLGLVFAMLMGIAVLGFPVLAWWLWV